MYFFIYLLIYLFVNIYIYIICTAYNNTDIYIYIYIYNHCHIAGEHVKKNAAAVVDPAIKADPVRHGMPQISTIT